MASTAASSEPPPAWEPCPQPNCRGAKLAAGVCLAHLDDLDPPRLDEELKRFTAEGTLDARGVDVSAALLERILAAAPRDAGGSPAPWRPRFDRATFGDAASFYGATFGDRAQVGPLLAGTLLLDQASFGRAPQIEVVCDRLGLDGARFLHGGTIRVAWADVSLTRAEFQAATIVTVAKTRDQLDSAAGLDRQAAPSALVEAEPDEQAGPTTLGWRTGRPRVLSLAGTDLTHLTLVGLDLRACRFAGAFHLDQLACGRLVRRAWTQYRWDNRPRRRP